VLDELLKNSVRMIIVSDNDLEILKVRMLKHDLANYFTDYCISETTKAYKPTAKFLGNLKKYISNDPNNCYIVGDMPFDVEYGKRLAIKSVLIDRKKAKLGIRADYVIKDLRELLQIMDLG
jgi:FMN phosphatase YigB (HAD superfamily)